MLCLRAWLGSAIQRQSVSRCRRSEWTASLDSLHCFCSSFDIQRVSEAPRLKSLLNEDEYIRRHFKEDLENVSLWFNYMFRRWPCFWCASFQRVAAVNFLSLQVVRSLISITLPRRVCVFFCLPLLVSNFSAHPTSVTLGPSALTATAKYNTQPLPGGCLAGQRLPPCRMLFAHRNVFTAVSWRVGVVMLTLHTPAE